MHMTEIPGVWELGPDGLFWLSVIVAIAAGLLTGGAVLAALTALSRKRAQTGQGEGAAESFDEKIRSLGSLAENLRVIAADVTHEAEAQIRAAEAAAEEARNNEEIASLSRGQAAAVSELFAEQGRTALRETKRFSWVSLIISVVVSNAVSVTVTVLLTMSMK